MLEKARLVMYSWLEERPDAINFFVIDVTPGHARSGLRTIGFLVFVLTLFLLQDLLSQSLSFWARRISRHHRLRHMSSLPFLKAAGGWICNWCDSLKVGTLTLMAELDFSRFQSDTVFWGPRCSESTPLPCRKEGNATCPLLSCTLPLGHRTLIFLLYELA